MVEPEGELAGETSLGYERIVFFSDAVFAIVITLLVLPLTAEFELPEEEAFDLLHQLSDMWPRILTFVVSFLVIGQFWMAHRRMWQTIERVTPVLLWLNLVCLLMVAFMQFPSAVLGSAPIDDDRSPVVFYAVALALASLATAAVWFYARLAGLLRKDLTPAQVSSYAVGSGVTVAAFVVSIGAAFVSLTAAVVCWVVLIPLLRMGVNRLRRSPA